MLESISNIKEPEYSSINRCVYFFENKLKVSLGDIDCWIAGGCFRAYFSKDEKIEDIDIFFKDRNEAAKCVHKFRSIGFKMFYSNKNAIKGYIWRGNEKVYIDIVKRFYDSPEDCLIDFDFSVCKFAWSPKTQVFYYSRMAFADVLSKKLVVPDTKFSNPLGSLKRLQKYINKGYRACNGTLITLAKGLNTIDLNNPDTNDIEFYPDGSSKIILFD
jgi:hypothetical protein